MDSHFGERLKSARKMAGLSMEKLAIKSGGVVSKQAINKYEKGKMGPSSKVLVALSQAVGVKPDYFFRTQKFEVLKFEFRKKARMLVREKESIQYRTLDFLERYFEIEEILEAKTSFENPLQDTEKVVKNVADIEKAVMAIRKAWELGETAPISKLMEILEDKGCRIFEIDASEDFEGISAYVDSVPVIAIRRQDDLVRKRLTILHELGHILLVFPDGMALKTKETLCYDFAGAFLLPEKVIKSRIGEHRINISDFEMKKIKGMYGISIRAIMKRLNRLNVIADHVYRSFCIWINQRYPRSEPGEYLGKEYPNRFKQLVYHAAAEEVITFSRAAELLNISLSEFRNEFQLVS
jgi:Zn-dependent peptidase ImmA (M78 family)/DNA-binding XRE family transcriptional regulator